jgi:hypothetical protein
LRCYGFIVQARAAFVVRIWMHRQDDGTLEPRGQILPLLQPATQYSFRTWSGLLAALKALADDAQTPVMQQPQEPYEQLDPDPPPDAHADDQHGAAR